MTSQEVEILRAFRLAGPMTLGQVSRATGIEPAAIGEGIEALMVDGLIVGERAWHATLPDSVCEMAKSCAESVTGIGDPVCADGGQIPQ